MRTNGLSMPAPLEHQEMSEGKRYFCSCCEGPCRFSASSTPERNQPECGEDANHLASAAERKKQ
jgi:hypothetical protein